MRSRRNDALRVTEQATDTLPALSLACIAGASPLATERMQAAVSEHLFFAAWFAGGKITVWGQPT